ncbi:MAG: FecR domain-containing protein [Gammaproteobacteria bacterium]|nr:FecR domain-containing protein [Gammaproteobacteria bacterium]
MFSSIKSVSLTVLLLLFAVFFNAHAESERYEFAESSRSIMRAGPGQSLSMLVQQIYPGYKQLWPRLEQEIKTRNPQAFNRYTGKIIPGQRMNLVTIKVLRKGSVLHLHVVGEVQSLKGFAKATDTRGNDRRLVAKAELYEGDRLTTDKDSSLVVKMVDDAEIHLKQNSSVRLTEYKMKSGFERGSRSILDLIKGGLRAITGAIGANPLSVYRFHTGVMTIGVRGTDYIAMLCEANDCEHSAGRNDADTQLHVVVLGGLISLQDEEGEVGELNMGQYAVATPETKVIKDDALPVNGLLNETEKKIYKEFQSSAKKSGAMWPWVIGGALLGI